MALCCCHYVLACQTIFSKQTVLCSQRSCFVAFPVNHPTSRDLFSNLSSSVMVYFPINPFSNDLYFQITLFIQSWPTFQSVHYSVVTYFPINLPPSVMTYFPVNLFLSIHAFLQQWRFPCHAVSSLMAFFQSFHSNSHDVFSGSWSVFWSCYSFSLETVSGSHSLSRLIFNERV